MNEMQYLEGSKHSGELAERGLHLDLDHPNGGNESALRDGTEYAPRPVADRRIVEDLDQWAMRRPVEQTGHSNTSDQGLPTCWLTLIGWPQPSPPPPIRERNLQPSRQGQTPDPSQWWA